MKNYAMSVRIREAGWPRMLRFECRANSLAMARAMCRAQAAISGWEVVSIDNEEGSCE